MICIHQSGMRFAVLLLLLLGAAGVRGVAVVPSAVFNEMMGSWRQAPATFEDPNLGSVRTVNSCELPACSSGCKHRAFRRACALFEHAGGTIAGARCPQACLQPR